MSGRQSVEASLDVVTGMLTVQSHDVYALIDPGSTLSYVTPYVAMEYGIEPEQLHESFSISTPDYDIDILYDPGKANVVVDALSRKSMGSLAYLKAYQRPLAKEVHRLASLGGRLADSREGGVIVQNRVESSLIVEVKEK
ncbi:uncharacterized protein [Nicotiana tomentosiformis]|uniref:uncharacterized protein n=1 Tax=Nicotiana tomentosiformis TaxID=4098 RepID=UPI00388C8CF1